MFVQQVRDPEWEAARRGAMERADASERAAQAAANGARDATHAALRALLEEYGQRMETLGFHKASNHAHIERIDADEQDKAHIAQIHAKHVAEVGALHNTLNARERELRVTHGLITEALDGVSKMLFSERMIAADDAILHPLFVKLGEYIDPSPMKSLETIREERGARKE